MRFHKQFKPVEDPDAAKGVWETELALLTAPSAYVGLGIRSNPLSHLKIRIKPTISEGGERLNLKTSKSSGLFDIGS